VSLETHSDFPIGISSAREFLRHRDNRASTAQLNWVMMLAFEHNQRMI
jgi:hypothetical protein